MADIIDLDFYRKFRVILPVYSPPLSDGPLYDEEKNTIKPCRKRRKANSSFSPETKGTERED